MQHEESMREANNSSNSRLTAPQDFMTPLYPHLSYLSSSTSATGYPVVELLYTVQPSNCNGLGNLHGGATSTLFDYCTTIAVAPLAKPGFWSMLGVSRTLNVTYLQPVPGGTRVVIECSVEHIGKRLCSLRGVMRRESDGVVLATCEHGKVNTDAPVSKV